MMKICRPVRCGKLPSSSVRRTTPTRHTHLAQPSISRARLGTTHRLRAAAVCDSSDVQSLLDDVRQLAERRQLSLSADAATSSASDDPVQESLNLDAVTSFTKASQSILSQLPNQQLAQCIKALALLAGDANCSIPPCWLTQYTSASFERLDTLTTTELSTVIWSLCELEHQPGAPWLDKFLEVSGRQLPDFYSPHLCDLVWGVSGIHRKAEAQLPAQWLAAFLEESRYQLDEFPADFAGFDLVKLVNGLAGHAVDLQQHPTWVDAFLKSAYLKSSSYAETACINQGLGRLRAGKMVNTRDSRCTHEEVSWLPRHERDMRRIMNNYTSRQWGGW